MKQRTRESWILVWQLEVSVAHIEKMRPQSLCTMCFQTDEVIIWLKAAESQTKGIEVAVVLATQRGVVVVVVVVVVVGVGVQSTNQISA